MKEESLINRINALEDKLALKELADNFSIVSDKKDNVAQASFFAESGVLTSIMGETTLTFSGRKEIADGFAKILAPLEIVYHHNGQHLITIDENTATGLCYCLATLIGKEGDKAYIRTIAANYNDEYVKENNKWLIAKRTATIAWEEKKEYNS
ncbi:nuclear transport factor 2 family protein [Flavihumibacter fluvii]|uniref:nuclear transport factor 2 family protein n=1 Tax=Flavihumibacter fluvii TaxID=2838157 RepID=UPI001BDE7D73|nr:nuclear transport factor 2 family protein [Flavihumibacter fluvii]ULQ50765.1 nuclear transport factor 2 family protein [Flavihumibacter fluvii]